jgi:16S rRNA (guanine966-N2)-methyltransferase
MRIISGEFGSRRIRTPPGSTTRPTLDKTRESLFSILTGRVAGMRVLDLFAGSGALGLEALSRGAAHAVFCDKSRQAAQAIAENIAALHLADRAKLMHMDWAQALRNLARERVSFDLIFLDPPYRMDYAPILQCITDYGALTDDGLLIAEHDAKMTLLLPKGLVSSRQKDYRDTRIDFIQRERPVP